MWRWATAHPVLFTVICVGQPAVIAAALAGIVRGLRRKEVTNEPRK
ncbi:hypothetical protein [Paenibacillus naphthalenovorans]